MLPIHETDAVDVDGSPVVQNYNGHRLAVYRLEDPDSRYEFEFVLFKDGSREATASELERGGASGPEDGGEPWTPQLFRHGRRCCDKTVDPEFDFGGAP